MTVREHREYDESLPRDLLLRCGHYIPDPALDGEARIERMEAYLVTLSEELEVLLPALAHALRTADSTDAGEAAGNGEG